MWLCATIDLSRAYEPDSDEADDSDDEADDSDDDSDDYSYPDSETHAFCEVPATPRRSPATRRFCVFLFFPIPASHPAGDERRVTAAGAAKRRGPAPRPPVEAPAGTVRAACCLGPRPLRVRAVCGSRVTRGKPSPGRRGRRAVRVSGLPPLPLVS